MMPEKQKHSKFIKNIRFEGDLINDTAGIFGQIRH